MIRRLSLWLLPEESASTRLTAVIAALARSPGGPVFAPHLTLLGGIQDTEPRVLGERAERLAAASLPIRLEGDGIHGEDAYFRCLTLRITRSPELMALRHEAAEMFGTTTPGPSAADAARGFVPHVSLFYGTIPSDIRRELAARIETGRLGNSPGAAHREMFLPEVFLSDGLAIVDTTGGVEVWRVIARTGGDGRS